MTDKIKWQDKDMEIRKQNEKEIEKYDVELTTRSNPMKVVEQGDGSLFLCNSDADESKDLESQGCTNYDTIAVLRHG